MEDKMVRMDDLKEGDKIKLRGGKKEYNVIAFCGGCSVVRGMLFIKDEDGKEWHRRYFPFTLVYKLKNKHNEGN